MRLTSLLPVLLPLLSPLASTSTTSSPQQIFTNPSSSVHGIPTVHESAIQARRILHLSSIATLSTVFPPSSPDTPSDLSASGLPIGLMEYYATCSPTPSDPIMLAITIATTFRNAAAGSNVTLSLRYRPPYHHPSSSDPYLYLPANLPRFSLIGYVEAIPEEEVQKYNVSGCFLERHPEAELWEPGNDIHESWWGRLVVQKVFFFGGFGDRAYIGWIPVEEWKGVTTEEMEECRLVGEEKEEKGGRTKVREGEENGFEGSRALNEQKYWS